jgi:hypothetical protein
MWRIALVFCGCASAASPEPVIAEDSGAPAEDTARPDVAETAPPANPAGNCPACEATKCRTELDACARDSACVTWLICMNECFRKPGAAACQAQCSETTKTERADAMTACKKANCAEACTPLD